jgi:hypothetical protein
MGLWHPLHLRDLQAAHPERRAGMPPSPSPPSPAPLALSSSLLDLKVEVPDYWLTFGNPWEIERVDIVYPVRFYGSTRIEKDAATGKERTVWEGGEVVQVR